MKILIVPDIHGSTEWKVIKNYPLEEYDYIVFMGDYFDSWENKWPEQGDNFTEICDFVRKDIKRRKLLIGNHDWSYLSKSREGSNCSGHQNEMIAKNGKLVESRAKIIKKLLLSAKDILLLAFECDDWVFSHAGFSKTAVNYMKIILSKIYGTSYDGEDFSVNLLNETFRKRLEVYNGNTKINWIPFDIKLDWDGHFSGSGDEPCQFCLWIRPDSLLSDSYYPKQVVGHTEMCIADYVALKNQKADEPTILVCTDSPRHNIFKIFDTQNPPEALTVSEYNKVYKNTYRNINNIKSRIGSMENCTIDFVLNELKRYFEDSLAERYYELFF